MNLSTTIIELRDERERLKERLRRIESLLRSMEHLNDVPTPAPFTRRNMQDQILAVLQELHGQYMKPRQIADLIGRNNGAVGTSLSYMRRAFKVEYDREKGYRVPTLSNHRPSDEYTEHGTDAGSYGGCGVA